MEFYKLLPFFVLGMALCSAATEGDNTKPAEKAVNSSVIAEKQTYTASQSTYLPADLSWKTGLGQAFVYVGIAAFSFVLVAGLTLLFAPLFGYKTCAIFGNCESSAIAYSSGGNLQNPPQTNLLPDYGPYYAGTPYSAYQKRSVDYMRPIIDVLTSKTR